MNEVVQVRMNSWIGMVKARNESGMTVREWCKANDVSELCKCHKKASCL